jgi:hypothetical protein
MRSACFIRSMRVVSLLLAVVFFGSMAKGAGWELIEDAKTGNQVAACTVNGTSPQGAVKATLVLHHRRGQPLKVTKKGAVTELPMIIELCVDAFESVKGFDFSAFEGPDATAADKNLVAVTIDAGVEHFVKRFNQSGWINQLDWLLKAPGTGDPISSSKNPDDFTFGIGDASRDVKDFIAIAGLLRKPEAKLEVTVTDSKDAKRQLRFVFPSDHATEVIAGLMR